MHDGCLRDIKGGHLYESNVFVIDPGSEETSPKSRISVCVRTGYSSVYSALCEPCADECPLQCYAKDNIFRVRNSFHLVSPERNKSEVPLRFQRILFHLSSSYARPKSAVIIICHLVMHFPTLCAAAHYPPVRSIIPCT